MSIPIPTGSANVFPDKPCIQMATETTQYRRIFAVGSTLDKIFLKRLTILRSYLPFSTNNFRRCQPTHSVAPLTTEFFCSKRAFLKKSPRATAGLPSRVFLLLRIAGKLIALLLHSSLILYNIPPYPSPDFFPTFPLRSAYLQYCSPASKIPLPFFSFCEIKYKKSIVFYSPSLPHFPPAAP